MVIYISLRFETNIGAKVHRSILSELYGEDNIFTFDLRQTTPHKENKYICYGKYKNPADRIIRWLQGNSMYINDKIIQEICNVIKNTNCELIFFENTNFGKLIKVIKNKFPKIKVVCFYHDIGADLYKQWNKHGTLVSVIENNIGIKQESLSQKYSDIDIVFNARDAKLYRKYYKVNPDYIVPLSTYEPSLPDFFVKVHPVPSKCKKKLIFIGSKYYPNVEGIRWFYKNVLLGLNDRIELDIVGRGTEFLRTEFTDSRVHVLGTVDDVFQYLYEADVFIAPLFSGGGMKAKSIEAISLGKCFVGNDESLAGFWEEMDDTVKNQVIFNCSTAEDWIQTLNTLSEQEIRKFNPALYKIFLEKFSYERTKEDFRRILNVQEVK